MNARRECVACVHVVEVQLIKSNQESALDGEGSSDGLQARREGEGEAKQGRQEGEWRTLNRSTCVVCPVTVSMVAWWQAQRLALLSGSIRATGAMLSGPRIGR